MAYRDDLLASRNQIAQRIREITAEANPTVSIDGVSVSRTEYLTALTNQLEVVEKALQRAGSPFFVMSKARA